MASQSANLFTVLILIIISLILPTISIEETTGKTLIANTCNQTDYPEDCISALESDPDSLNANLTGLTKILIEQSGSKLDHTLHVVTELVSKETDYATWSSLVFCRHNYNVSVHKIKEGLEAFDLHKYDVSYQRVVDLNKAVSDCDRQGVQKIAQVNSDLFKISKDTVMFLDLLF